MDYPIEPIMADYLETNIKKYYPVQLKMIKNFINLLLIMVFLYAQINHPNLTFPKRKKTDLLNY